MLPRQMQARKIITAVCTLPPLMCVSITYSVYILIRSQTRPQSMEFREMGLRPRNLQHKKNWTMLEKYFRCPCTCVLIVSHYSCPHAHTNGHCLLMGRKSLTALQTTRPLSTDALALPRAGQGKTETFEEEMFRARVSFLRINSHPLPGYSRNIKPQKT